MDFVRMDLMNYCLSDNTHKSRVVDNYGLIQFGEVSNYRDAQEDVKMREEEEGSKSESDETDSMLSRWQQREVEELRRDIRNLWHCESN